MNKCQNSLIVWFVQVFCVFFFFQRLCSQPHNVLADKSARWQFDVICKPWSFVAFRAIFFPNCLIWEFWIKNFLNSDILYVLWCLCCLDRELLPGKERKNFITSVLQSSSARVNFESNFEDFKVLQQITLRSNICVFLTFLMNEFAEKVFFEWIFNNIQIFQQSVS